MPMNPMSLQAQMELRIYAGLKKEFSSAAGKGAPYTPIADEHWMKLAKAISGIAADIVLEIVKNAEVTPGIPTAGSPAAQVTVAPGKIT